jgi:two-component system response regulator HydG
VPFHARIVAATNRDLEQEIEEGNFREDLFYRLNVVGVVVPPLRARGSDILLLAQHFVDQFAEKLNRPVRGISKPAAERLMRYDWPGNVRELANCIERAVVLTQFDHLTVEDLPENLQRYRSPDTALSGVPESCSLEELERLHIERTLKRFDNNKSQASQVLGIDRRTLYRKLRRYGIDA